MCWNHVVWCCFYAEKCKKEKRKPSAFENHLHHISTMGALSDIIQTDSGSYIAGLQLWFFDHFRKLVMWPPSQQAIRWTLRCILSLIFVSSTFWSSPMIFLFLDIYSGPWKQYLTSYTSLLLFFLFFFLIFWLFLVQWNILGLRMKYLLKVAGIYMKSAMKYPRSKNKISIESARHPYEKRNEISWI